MNVLMMIKEKSTMEGRSVLFILFDEHEKFLDVQCTVPEYDVDTASDESVD